MKYTTLAVLSLAFLPALRAQDTIQARWDEVCRVAGPNELAVTTGDGTTVKGACFALDVNGITIKTRDNKVIKIARAKLEHIRMTGRPTHNFISLWKSVGTSLNDGLNNLFSPLAPVGLVQVPGSLAWGAIATPFCLLKDLDSLGNTNKEITII